MSQTAKNIDDFHPTDEDRKGAEVALRQLAEKDAMEVPSNLKGILTSMLERISQGESLSLISNDKEFTTQEAAQVLRVSRMYLIKLLDEGKIPYRKVGKHRRVLTRDLMAYKNSLDKQRDNALEKLAALGQEMEDDY